MKTLLWRAISLLTMVFISDPYRIVFWLNFSSFWDRLENVCLLQFSALRETLGHKICSSKNILCAKIIEGTLLKGWMAGSIPAVFAKLLALEASPYYNCCPCYGFVIEAIKTSVAKSVGVP